MNCGSRFDNYVHHSNLFLPFFPFHRQRGGLIIVIAKGELIVEVVFKVRVDLLLNNLLNL